MSALDALLARTEKRDAGHSSPCWEWQGPKGNGYGRCSGKGHSSVVHRAVWTLMRGEIAAGLHIDHLCRNRACCNPDHLEPVTPAENVKRALSYKRRTHCRRGHLLTSETLYHRSNGETACSVCQNDGRRRRRQRAREQAGLGTRNVSPPYFTAGQEARIREIVRDEMAHGPRSVREGAEITGLRRIIRSEVSHLLVCQAEAA